MTASNFEDHLLIVDDFSVTKPSSKLPIHHDNEFAESKPDCLQHILSFDVEKRGRIDVKGLIKADQQQQQQVDAGKLLKGEVHTVTAQEIKKQLLFAQGRMVCSEYFIENDVDQVVKILAELEEYELAIDLALESKDPAVNVAYPLAVMMSSAKKEDNEMKDVSENREEGNLESVEADYFKKIIPRLNLTQLIDTV